MKLLRTAALLAMPVGAAGAIVLFFRAADHPPPLVVVGFIVWLISPFVLLAGMRAASTRWSPAAQLTLHVVTVLIAAVSLLIYSGLLVVTRAGAPSAAPFVVVAPASWLITGIVVALAVRRS
jgi:FtsH-binding integral membrane protein